MLAIGGLKEKLLAAVRGGIRTALIPEENVKDLAEIPDNIKNAIEILPVKWIDRVLDRGGDPRDAREQRDRPRRIPPEALSPTERSRLLEREQINRLRDRERARISEDGDGPASEF